MNEKTLDRVVFWAILVNLAIAAVVLFHESETLELMDVAILWFFAGELMYRVARHGMPFFRNFWNSFDAAVIMVALLPVAGGAVALLRLVRVARSVHLARHVSHLRVVRWLLGREPVHA